MINALKSGVFAQCLGVIDVYNSMACKAHAVLIGYEGNKVYTQ